MTLQEIQYKAQGIIQKWRDNDAAPYVEFVEELALMEVPEPQGLDEPSYSEVMETLNQVLIDWRNEAKTEEEKESRFEAHKRFFEIYDEAIMVDDEPQGLDEAAEEYTKGVHNPDNFVESLIKSYEFDAFKAGAKWMAEQGVSVDGEVSPLGIAPNSSLKRAINENFELGDKVIVQIRKK